MNQTFGSDDMDDMIWIIRYGSYYMDQMMWRAPGALLGELAESSWKALGEFLEGFWKAFGEILESSWRAGVKPDSNPNRI